MQVLHSVWDTKTFYIWAESSSLPLSQTSADCYDNQTEKPTFPHPFALPGIELKSLLHELFQPNDGRVETLALRLPSGKQGLLPPPGSSGRTSLLKNQLPSLIALSRPWPMSQFMPLTFCWTCPPILPRARFLPTRCSFGRNWHCFLWSSWQESSSCPPFERPKPSGSR